jgi:hypothetical protein
MLDYLLAILDLYPIAHLFNDYRSVLRDYEVSGCPCSGCQVEGLGVKEVLGRPVEQARHIQGEFEGEGVCE